MNWNTLQRTPLFFTIIHSVLILFTMVFCSYLFAITQTTLEIQRIEQRKAELTELTNIFSTQKNYLQSETFFIRYLKEVEQRKLKGEQVINTSDWEKAVDNSGNNYIPEKPVLENNNIWFQCLHNSIASCLSTK